jgi:predicted methyltransferase
MKYLKIRLDIDEVLCDFINPYYKRFGIPKNDYKITYDVQNILRKDKHFWENLPVLNTINFEPELYCTKRV